LFYYTLNGKKWKLCFCFFTDGKQHKARELDMITPRNHALRSHMTWLLYPWPWVSLTWLLYNLQLWRHRRWFRKFPVRFRPIRKEIVSSMYNNEHSRIFIQSLLTFQLELKFVPHLSFSYKSRFIWNLSLSLYGKIIYEFQDFQAGILRQRRSSLINTD